MSLAGLTVFSKAGSSNHWSTHDASAEAENQTMVTTRDQTFCHQQIWHRIFGFFHGQTNYLTMKVIVYQFFKPLLTWVMTKSVDTLSDHTRIIPTICRSPGTLHTAYGRYTDNKLHLYISYNFFCSELCLLARNINWQTVQTKRPQTHTWDWAEFVMWLSMWVNVYWVVYLVSWPARARLPARNSLVNEVEFLGLITQK